MSDCITSTIFPTRLRIDKLGFPTNHYPILQKSIKCSTIKTSSSTGISSIRNQDDHESPEFELMDKKDELEMEQLFKFRGEVEGGDGNKLGKGKDFFAGSGEGLDGKFEELGRCRDNDRGAAEVVKGRRQMMRRSNVVAKQVISISTAISLGFVSQLWVDTSSWTVLVVEVRPNLLSGDCESFLLKEISRVGDVILVEDETVMEVDLKLVGLETLVGYSVVTPSSQRIGKVRGYTFNINSGTVEALEIDSFGISIIPSSLVSTYALFVDDVLDVFPDKVVVHEAAVTCMQRLTKGFWDGQNAINSFNEIAEQLDANGQRDYEGYKERRRKSSRTRKIRQKMRKRADDLELPMDFL